MAGKFTAIDPGSSTVKVLVAKDGKTGVQVLRFGAANAAEGADGMAGLGIPLKDAVVGIAGRDMTLRYTQVPPSPDWQLRNLMDLEIQDMSSQSGGDLSADYNLLPVVDEESGMDTVLMALARNDALESVSSTVVAAGGSVAGHIPNCVALYNAYLRCARIDDEEELVCLANIGRETTDIALVRGQDLLFVRNLSSGGKVLDDAIASGFNVSERKAESLKRDLLDLDPASRGRYASGQAEKITLAAGGASSMLVSAIQSSLAFCQTQTKIEGLRLDRVLLAGGSAKLRGLKGMLREALRCPAELFDPWEATDLSALPAADAEQLDEMRSESVIALGLALSRGNEDLYSLEILPERVRRRQRFTRRTIYNIGAGLVGAALLALTAMTAKSSVSDGEAAYRKLSTQRKRVMATHGQAEDIIAKNATERAIVDQLSLRSIPLDGLLRVQRAVHDTLPPELWIESVEVKSARTSGSRRGAARPVIELKGYGKPVGGTDVGVAFRKFLSDFRGHDLIKEPERPAATPDDESPATARGGRPQEKAQRVAVNHTPSAEKTAFTFTVDFLSHVAGDEGGR